jgi:hypothetical protein
MIKKDDMGRASIAYITLMRNDYKVLVGKPEGKRLFGRCRHRLEDTVKIVHKGGYGLD